MVPYSRGTCLNGEIPGLERSLQRDWRPGASRDLGLTLRSLEFPIAPPHLGFQCGAMLDREWDPGSNVALRGDPGQVTYAPCGPHLPQLSDEAVGQVILLRLWGPLGTPSEMERTPNPGPGAALTLRWLYLA